eukprot:2482716-Amphidinium_carterae.1
MASLIGFVVTVAMAVAMAVTVSVSAKSVLAQSQLARLSAKWPCRGRHRRHYCLASTQDAF